MVRVMAAIHSVDVDAVGLADYGQQRQLLRASGGALDPSSTGLSETDLTARRWRRLIDGAAERGARSTAARAALVHGDFRIDNLIFDRAT
jgi:aminoglycoside phosphotransferase (APT) family kinase protein